MRSGNWKKKSIRFNNYISFILPAVLSILGAAGFLFQKGGYATPQGLRNVLIICATPYQWKHIIGQRVYRRNTDETRIVLLKIWQELFSLSPVLFAPVLPDLSARGTNAWRGK